MRSNLADVFCLKYLTKKLLFLIFHLLLTFSSTDSCMRRWYAGAWQFIHDFMLNPSLAHIFDVYKLVFGP